MVEAPVKLDRAEQGGLDALNKEIKQLTDRKASNDNIENDVLVDNKLNQTLDDALMKADRKVVRNLIEKVERAKQMMSKKDEYVLTQVNKLLDELKRVQANKVYKDFYVMIDSRNLKDLNSFKDSEIDVLVEGVSNGSITTGGNNSFENLFLSMSDAHKNPEKFKHTDRKYFNKVYTAIQNNLGIDSDDRTEKLADMKLDRIFGGESGSEGLKAEELANLVGTYTDISPRDGGPLPEGGDFKEGVEASGFTYAAFAKRFNKVNEERIEKVKKSGNGIIDNFVVDDLTVEENGDNITFKKGGSEVDLLDLLGVKDEDKKGLDILGVDELKLEHFREVKKEWEKILKTRIEAENTTQNDSNEGAGLSGFKMISNPGKNLDQTLVTNINGVAGEGKDFLSYDAENGLSCNLENAKNFLKTIDEGNFNTYWSISRTGGVGVNISNWRAINSAVQILLNEQNPGLNLTVDGKWIHSKNKSRNAYYNAIGEFQDKNSLTPKRRGHLDLQTLNVLLGNYEKNLDGHSSLDGVDPSISEGGDGNLGSTINYGDGSKYTGGVFDGKKNGEGKCTWYNNNGSIDVQYDGHWKLDMMDGEGKCTWYNNGSIKEQYDGHWEDGKKHGEGKYTWYNNNGSIVEQYDGQWKDDKKSGEGKNTWYNNNGSIEGQYDGHWEHGEWNGIGTLTYANENTFVGNFENGKMISGRFTIKSGGSDNVYDVVRDSDFMKITGPADNPNSGKFINQNDGGKIIDNPPSS